MNFSAGLRLFKNLVLKHLGSVFGYHTDSSIRIHTHTGKHLVEISPIGMELMFIKYILGQYMTLTSDVVSWVEEDHEIMSDKGFF